MINLHKTDKHEQVSSLDTSCGDLVLECYKSNNKVSGYTLNVVDSDKNVRMFNNARLYYNYDTLHTLEYSKLNMYNNSGSIVDTSTCAENVIVVPPVYNNIAITRLQSLGENDKVQEITFPESLSEIDTAPFDRCPNLARVVFEGSLTPLDTTLDQLLNSDEPDIAIANFFHNIAEVVFTNVTVSDLTNFKNTYEDYCPNVRFSSNRTLIIEDNIVAEVRESTGIPRIIRLINPNKKDLSLFNTYSWDSSFFASNTFNKVTLTFKLTYEYVELEQYFLEDPKIEELILRIFPDEFDVYTFMDKCFLDNVNFTDVKKICFEGNPDEVYRLCRTMGTTAVEAIVERFVPEEEGLRRQAKALIWKQYEGSMNIPTGDIDYLLEDPTGISRYETMCVDLAYSGRSDVIDYTFSIDNKDVPIADYAIISSDQQTYLYTTNGDDPTESTFTIYPVFTKRINKTLAIKANVNGVTSEIDFLISLIPYSKTLDVVLDFGENRWPVLRTHFVGHGGIGDIGVVYIRVGEKFSYLFSEERNRNELNQLARISEKVRLCSNYGDNTLIDEYIEESQRSKVSFCEIEDLPKWYLNVPYYDNY